MEKGKKQELLEQIMLSVPEEIKKMNNPMALYASIKKSIKDYISGKSWKEGANDELLKSLTPNDILFSILAETEYQKENNNPEIVLNLVGILIALAAAFGVVVSNYFFILMIVLCFIFYYVYKPGRDLLKKSKYANYINIAAVNAG